MLLLLCFFLFLSYLLYYIIITGGCYIPENHEAPSSIGEKGHPKGIVRLLLKSQCHVTDYQLTEVNDSIII